MIARTRLTLQDYFDRAGIQPRQARPRTDHGPSGFGHVLAAIQAKAGPQSTVQPAGLTISDYLKTPVPAQVQKRFVPVPEPPGGSASSPVKPDETIERTEAAKICAAAQPRQIGQPAEYILPIRQNGDEISESICRAAAKYHLPAELIRGVIQAESDFQVRAVSPAGAQGLMQLMPDTARELGVEDPFDIDQNIDGGSQYLRKMLDRFGGDLKLALAAYNAGPGTVAKYGGRVPPFAETRAYVQKVLHASHSLPA
jgi:soluble lytic murein transglycosylase-like protein